MKRKSRKEFRTRRHQRLRHKIRGTAARPRMAVSVSLKHIHVQVIDDEAAQTLGAVSTQGREPAVRISTDTAKGLGKEVAELVKAKGIEAVVFDRGGSRYTGRVQAVADGAREAGLKI